MELLRKLIGATAEGTTLRPNSIAPETHAAVQLDQATLVDSSRASKLTRVEVATLAYMWQVQFSVDSKLLGGKQSQCCIG